MVGLLITGHGHFATGLGTSLKLITGATEKIVYVDFEADHTIDTLKANLMKGIDELKGCDGVLVLSDLAGGSPFKTALECKFERMDQAIEVVAGSNLPMLIEGSMSMAAYDSPLDMAEALMEAGKDYIVRFELAEHRDDVQEDGI